MPAQAGGSASDYRFDECGQIRRALITQVVPRPLVSGEAFRVNLTMELPNYLDQAFTHDLQIYVDAQPATKAVFATSPAGAGGAAAPPGVAAAMVKREVTLFGVAPEAGAANAQGEVTVYDPTAQCTVATTTAGIYAHPTTASKGSELPTLYEPLTVGGAVLAALAVLLGYWSQRSATKQARYIDELKDQANRQQEQARLREADLQARLLALADEKAAAGRAARDLDAGRREQPRDAVIPEEVIRAARRGTLAVVIGPGTSAQSGLPTYAQLVGELARGLAAQLELAERNSLQAYLERSEYDEALEALVARLGREPVVRALRKFLAASESRPSQLHRLLAELQVLVFVDLTWDALLATALSIGAEEVYGVGRSEGFAHGSRARKRQLIKPYGSIQEPPSLALTQREYKKKLAAAPELSRSLGALLTSHTVFFVGVSRSGIDRFLDGLPAELETSSGKHFALLPSSGHNALWEASVSRRFGVRVIDFIPGDDFSQVRQAVETLVSAAPIGTGRPNERMLQASARLNYVQLTSIGIFTSIRLDLSPGWTLLLGNNGCGKSTLLRAIALALSGNDSRVAGAAGRLLRSGDMRGIIEVGIGEARIMSILRRDGSVVLLQSPQTTALQAGQILVLGFPALRGISPWRSNGPTAANPADPSVDDVMPLVANTVDSRLNDVQQWLVNATVRAEAEPQGRDAQMVATFGRLVASIAPGGVLRYGRFDRNDLTVYFRTESGEVPFDGISQGMSSILNWVGVLLQRLYDVFPNSTDPAKEPALVLIDEIDAHLHPRWQRQLVALAREHFPNVQVVASSHSPLLAGSVRHEELRVIQPGPDGTMVAKPPPEDVSGQKAEDILTSSAFALSTTRSPDAEGLIKRYYDLYEKRRLADTEEGELLQLAERVEALGYGLTREQRSANAELRQAVEAQLQGMSSQDVVAARAFLSPGAGVGNVGDLPDIEKAE